LFTYLHTRLLVRRALNAYVLGDYAKAERLFLKLRAKQGDTQLVLRNLGLVRMAQGDLAGAESYFLHELERFGPAPDRLQALADVAYLSGDRQKAARRIKDVLEDPGCTAPKLYGQRAAICGDAAAYARAMQGKRDFAEGNARLASKDVDGALAAFRRAAAADPTDFAALNNIGGILLNQKEDPAGAAEAFSRALALQPLPMLKRNVALAEAMLKQRGR